MFNLSFLKKWDDYLIRNRPHVWLSNIHYNLPLSAALLLLSFLVSLFLPLQMDVYIMLTYVSFLAIGAYIGIFGRQYLLYNRALLNRQLNHLFLINLLQVFLIFFVALSLPLLFSLRVHLLMEKESIQALERKTRIAMVPNHVIKFIKEKRLDLISMAEADSIRYVYPDDGKANDPLVQVLWNPFLAKSPFEHLLSEAAPQKPEADKPAVSMSVDTATFYHEPSGLYEVVDSGLIIAIRNLRLDEISYMKQTVNHDLKKMGFSIFQHDENLAETDPSRYKDKLDEYFAKVENQSENLITTNSFFNTIKKLLFPISALVLLLSQTLTIGIITRNILLTISAAWFSLLSFFSMFLLPGSSLASDDLLFIFSYTGGLLFVSVAGLRLIFLKQNTPTEWRLLLLTASYYVIVQLVACILVMLLGDFDNDFVPLMKGMNIPVGIFVLIFFAAFVTSLYVRKLHAMMEEPGATGLFTPQRLLQFLVRKGGY